MRSARSLASIASLALLAAGCDYWRNLVDDKAVTHTTVSITVKDAWTGEGLPYADCVDTARHLYQSADSAGTILIPEAATGPYRMTCSRESYSTVEIQFDAGAKDISLGIQLARRGGRDWYPMDSSRQVRAELIGNTRVPANFMLRAWPARTDGTLRYSWAFARHPQLNRDQASSLAFKPELAPKLESIASDSLEDTVTLKVRAHLYAIPEYDVDSVKIPILWMRNKKPRLEISTNNRTDAIVGCPDDGSFTVSVSASDPDGQCLSVRVENTDSNSTLGPRTIVQSCNQKQIAIPLTDSMSARQIPWRDPLNRFLVTATDDNNQTHDTEFTIRTTPHQRPTIGIYQNDSMAFSIANYPVRFRITAVDSNASLERLKVDWGDGSKPLDYGFPAGTGPLNADFTHPYSVPGNYFVHASIINACGTVSTSALPGLNYVHVQANDTPKVAVTDRKYILIGSKPHYSIRLNADDKDLGFAKDTLTLSVNWGDGTEDSTYRSAVALTNKALDHVYETPPADSVYIVGISVIDVYGGRYNTVLRVAPYSHP